MNYLSSSTKKLLIFSIILMIIGILVFVFANIQKTNNRNEKRLSEIVVSNEDNLTNVDDEKESNENIGSDENNLINVDTVTGDFKISGYYSEKGKSSEYICYVYREDDEEEEENEDNDEKDFDEYEDGEVIYINNNFLNYETLNIDAKKFKLPSNMYDYKDFLLLRVTYSKEDYKVCDCKVVNLLNQEIISEISDEKILELFDVEYGKKVKEKEIKYSESKYSLSLSELEENEVYNLIPSVDSWIPNEFVKGEFEIKNDIEKNCIIFIKYINTNEKDDDNKYDKEFLMCNSLTSSEFTTKSFNIEENYKINIMYKVVDNKVLANLIEMVDMVNGIIYLSDSIVNDKVLFRFEHYLYNDMDKDIIVEIKEKYKSNNIYEVVLKAHEIYEFDWMSIEEVVVKTI